VSGAGLSVDVRVERKDFTLDLAFDAPPGVTAILGPSGAGKSTALAAIVGVATPSRGTIALDGDVWFDARAGVDVPPEARRVALVFQSLALFPHLDALANVAYGMRGGEPREARRSRARAALERFGVGHLAARRPATFSGGEAQRVAIARALAIEPRVVLLDEPFSALDPELRAALAADVRAAVADLGVPALLVTHHRGEARALATRALRIERGRVVASGDVDDLVRASDGDDA
jgi:molybdate transport system ATP-binding protein